MRSDFVSFFLPVNYKMTSYISKTNKQTNKLTKTKKQNKTKQNKKKTRMFTYTHY